MNHYLLALILYSILLIAIGILVSRRVKRALDFLVAGRSLGPGLIFATFLAANIGAGSTVVSDMPDGVVAYGSPCRVIRRRNPADNYY